MGVGVGTRFHTGSWEGSGGGYGTIFMVNLDDEFLTASYDVHMDGETTEKTFPAKQVEDAVWYARRLHQGAPSGGGEKDSKQAGGGSSGGKQCKGGDASGPHGSPGVDGTTNNERNSDRDEGSDKEGSGNGGGDNKRKHGSAGDGKRKRRSAGLREQSGAGDGTGEGGGGRGPGWEEDDKEDDPDKDPGSGDDENKEKVSGTSTVLSVSCSDGNSRNGVFFSGGPRNQGEKRETRGNPEIYSTVCPPVKVLRSCIGVVRLGFFLPHMLVFGSPKVRNPD